MDRSASIKDLIESLGIPHVEVGRVLVHGEEVGFDHRVCTGDEIEVFPPASPESAPVEAAPAPPAGETCAFVLDVHLGKLARILRLLGFDALYRNDWDDPELARMADAEGRVLLTRDRQLLKRRMVRRGYCVRSGEAQEQAREIIRRFGRADHIRPWTRCLKCNGAVEQVEKSEVLLLLQPKTKLYYEKFYRCAACGQVYWEGSHTQRLKATVEKLAGGRESGPAEGPQ